MIKNILLFLTYCWRVFATALSFSIFGLGGIVLTFFIFPLILVLIRDEVKRKRILRLMICYCFRSFVYCMHYLALMNFRKINEEYLIQEKGSMVIANHPTLIDVVAIIAYTPNACCIVKKELWENFFVKNIVQVAGYVKNDSNIDEMFSKCAEAINNNDVLIIFPEGTRTKADEVLNFKRGAAHLAIKIGCPVRCVSILCSPRTLMKGVPWYKVAPKRVLFEMKVHSQIMPNQEVNLKQSRGLAARDLTEVFLKQYCS